MRVAFVLVLAVSLAFFVPSAEPAGHDEVCDMCRRVTDTIERVLILNTTSGGELRFEGMSRGLCKYVPPSLKKIVRTSIGRAGSWALPNPTPTPPSTSTHNSSAATVLWCLPLGYGRRHSLHARAPPARTSARSPMVSPPLPRMHAHPRSRLRTHRQLPHASVARPSRCRARANPVFQNVVSRSTLP